jgi:hypothetical protein
VPRHETEELIVRNGHLVKGNRSVGIRSARFRPRSVTVPAVIVSRVSVTYSLFIEK